MKTEGIKFKYSVTYSIAFVSFLWLVKAIEWTISMDFGIFGIHPRTLKGTFGILTGPLIHGDLTHLLSNSFPLILLGIGVFYFYNKIALEVFIWIYLMTGFWVWIAARDAYHIGASGIVYGLVAFLFFSGLFRKDTRSIAIAMVVIFLYGGMVYGIVPADNGISWESHILGSFAGIFCAFYFRRSGGIIMQPEITETDNEGQKEKTNHNHTYIDPVEFNYDFVPGNHERIEHTAAKHYYYFTMSSHQSRISPRSESELC